MDTFENSIDEHQVVNDIPDWELKLNEKLAKNHYGFYKSRSEIHYGPPPNWNDQIPNHANEVFIGALPRDVNIYELLCLIESTLGENIIYELSVMLDTSHNYSSLKVMRNRGFAFVTFQNKVLAAECRELLDNKEIRPGKRIRMNQSTPNLHLFVANVPSIKNREELLRDLREFTDGLVDVMIFAAKTGSGEMDSKRHRGFVFLEYETHSAAANARRKLSKPGFRLWNRELKVDWAAKKQEPSQEVMSKVKSIYVRNLTSECTDQNLRDYFSQYGEIESIKKVRDFAFIHFKDRSSAISALDVSNKTVLPNDISNGTIDVELVKPNINSQYKSVGFSFSNLLTPPFLSYPYGLPLPPPPAHLLPPPHLMYGMTSPANVPSSNKNKPSTAWHIMNGIKNSNLSNNLRSNKINLQNNRPTSAFVRFKMDASKKRVFKKFYYRGIDLDQLLEMNIQQCSELVRARIRRRLSRGLKRQHETLLKKLRQAKKAITEIGEKPSVVKTHLRNMIILPEMVGSMVGVYNGKTFNHVEIKPEMIGHYLGEFSLTYKPVKHGRPGIGATHSSRFIPLK